MSLGSLEIAIRGRRPKGGDQPLVAAETRQLTLEDVAKLGADRGSKTPAISQLRMRHHALARSVAAGISAIEISAITGYSLSRISILQNDPSFAELVEHYKGLNDEAFLAAQVDANLMAQQVKIAALEELGDRMENATEDFTNGQLLEIAKTMMDRTGQGVATSTTVNHNIGIADRLKAARTRVIDITPARRSGVGVVGVEDPGE